MVLEEGGVLVYLSLVDIADPYLASLPRGMTVYTLVFFFFRVPLGLLKA